MRKIVVGILLATIIQHSCWANEKEGGVVVSIKPLHSLVAGVMAGDGRTPLLLVDGKASLHDFALKPSQARALQTASLVFYMGDEMETFMGKTLASLPKTVRRADMDKNPGLNFLTVRTGEGFEPHEHGKDEGHGHHEHEENARDLHLWMNPLNAKIMVMEIARQLSISFPEQRSIYFANAKALGARLDRLDADVDRRMSALQGKPFVVFHDAYQYFETRYHLRMVGALTLNPQHSLGAKHISELRAKVKEAKVNCVFAEPQFDGKIMHALLDGTEAKSGTLDPEGALLTPGPELYFQLIEGVAAGLESCLR